MLRLFTGWDAREGAGWHAFVDSVHKHASVPVSICRLPEKQGDGSNRFTYSRFMVPELCDYRGWAIYADGCDMLCRADIAELWALRDDRFAVQVVKHSYTTNYPKKYVGTDMESVNVSYERKNWSSLILWNCGHYPHMVKRDHGFSWLRDSEIGELPAEWNWLADEYGANKAAKLLHFTAGMPVQALHM